MTKILKTLAEVRDFHTALNGKTLGLVPTMGNLHDGHLSLMQIAQENADVVMASIFVNPTQFGENEDLSSYPRTFDADLEKLQNTGVDAVFFPDETTIYPHGKHNTLSIEMPVKMTQILCGQDRPTHFQGVATVVAKLFQIVRPDVAVFGEKDFQQLAVIRHLNEELFMSIKLLPGKIIRETDGLAMSSRNQYLNADERDRAVWLSKTLTQCKTRLLDGDAIPAVIADGKKQLEAQGIQVEYLDLRDAETLSKNPASGRGVLLVAGRLGTTRLIDNIRIN